jgi:hypothetical protein
VTLSLKRKIQNQTCLRGNLSQESRAQTSICDDIGFIQHQLKCPTGRDFVLVAQFGGIVRIFSTGTRTVDQQGFPGCI